MLKHIVLCAALLTGVSTLGVYGLDPTMPIRPHVLAASKADVNFVSQATQGGMGEVLLADLAIKKTTSDDVKTFAQTMKKDHTKANEKLADIAQAKGITLPTEASHHDTKMYDKLNKLEGVAFDRAYIVEEIKAHQGAVTLFEKEADTGMDAQLKAFAGDTLPTLRHHWDMAKDLDTKLAASVNNQ